MHGHYLNAMALPLLLLIGLAGGPGEPQAAGSPSARRRGPGYQVFQ